MTDRPLLGAIEAGGTKFVVALARPGGEILAQTRLPTTMPDETMPAVLAFLGEQAARAGGRLAAVGVASFGPLDRDPASPAYGTITTTPKPGWAGMNYRDWLAPLGAPVAIDTDVNGAALGEWRAGAGRGCTTLAYTTVGTGIGTGVLHAGVPLAGFAHYESGHIRVPRAPGDDLAGTCPWHGDCLEGLAAGPAVAARFGAPLDELADPAPAIELVAGYLAELAVNLVLLHAPHRLVFGGGVMKAPGLLAALRRETGRRLAGYITSPWLDPGLARYIVAPGLGDRSGIAGAAALAEKAAKFK